MDAQQVVEILRQDLDQGRRFDNWHGISQDNLSQFLVDPTLIEIVDDKASMKLSVWLVLREFMDSGGYVIGYHAPTALWVLAYHEENRIYRLVSRSKYFARLLTRM